MKIYNNLIFSIKNFLKIKPAPEGRAVVHEFPCLHRQDRLFIKVNGKYSCVSLQPMDNSNGGVVPQKVNHCTAFNDRYYVFFSY